MISKSYDTNKSIDEDIRVSIVPYPSYPGYDADVNLCLKKSEWRRRQDDLSINLYVILRFQHVLAITSQ